MCHVSLVNFFWEGDGQGGVSRWGVCYQQGLPSLVYSFNVNSQTPDSSKIWMALYSIWLGTQDPNTQGSQEHIQNPLKVNS